MNIPAQVTPCTSLPVTPLVRLTSTAAAVNITDVDVPGVTIRPDMPSSTTLVEGRATPYAGRVQLTSRPLGSVTVTPVPVTGLSVAPSSLLFPASIARCDALHGCDVLPTEKPSALRTDTVLVQVAGTLNFASPAV